MANRVGWVFRLPTGKCKRSQFFSNEVNPASLGDCCLPEIQGAAACFHADSGKVEFVERLGPYQLENVLGRGGMGTVYSAVDTESGQRLAVKVLAPTYSTDAHFRNRFESEIKALLKLDHPNIVRLIGFGQDDSNLYFAMELVQGQSLFQLQRQGMAFDWREVIRIGKNVALGLRHAHDRGVIHRDLKPGNLLKAEQGIIKITDFGIAKRFGADQNTGTNVLGTVDFMSPEQAKGQPVSERSDLYSLGTVMYTLLAGRPPFTANSFEESLRNLTKVPAPRIAIQAPDVPAPLDDLIAQLLAKDPEQRVPTALALHRQLKQVESELLDTSQAKTAERPLKLVAARTLAKADPITSLESQRSGPTVAEDGDFVAPSAEDSTETSQELQPGGLAEIGPDFHRPVDEVKRQVANEDRPKSAEHSAWEKLMPALLLASVLLIGGMGWYWAYAVPPPEKMLALFAEKQEQPQLVLTEIDQFLEHYGDHDEREWVEELHAVAKANQKFNYLSARRNRSGLLSEVERELLQIMDLEQRDAPRAATQLDAFISLHKSDQSLEKRDRECVSVAEGYLPRLEQNATEQKQTVRRQIEKRLKRAAEVSPEQSETIYRSIVEFHQDKEWAADLVAKAENQLVQER